MKVRYFFAAKFAEQTRSGTTNVIGGGLNLIRANRIPFEVTTLFAVGRVALDRGEAAESHSLKVRLADPDGESIFEGDENTFSGQELLPHQDTLFAGFSLGIIGLVFEREGRYNLELLFNGEVVDSWPLGVELDPDRSTASDEISTKDV